MLSLLRKDFVVEEYTQPLRSVRVESSVLSLTLRKLEVGSWKLNFQQLEVGNPEEGCNICWPHVAKKNPDRPR